MKRYFEFGGFGGGGISPEELELLMEAEHLQEDCHKTVEAITYKNKKANVQGATNVWIYRKLAEQELRLRKIESFLNL